MLPFLAMCLMLCSLSECREDINPFEETNSGRRTIACYLNGEPYSQKLTYRMEAKYDVFENGYYFAVSATLYSDELRDENGNVMEAELMIWLSDQGTLEAGKKYQFGKYESRPEGMPAYYALLGYDNLCSAGWIEIRNITVLDTGDAIISGNFEFEGTYHETDEEFHVTGGTFDMVAPYVTHDWPLE